MAQKTITIILVLIVLGGLAWYIDKGYLRDNPSNLGGQSTNQNLQSIPAQNSLVYVNSGNANEILLWQNGSSKKAFTDSDEAEKILKTSNLASGSKEVLAITSSGKLESINLNNATTQTLQSLFNVPKAWSVSDDGQYIAYVSFSNTEEKYGFTLYTDASKGGLKSKITNSDTEIRALAWNKSQELAFTTTFGTQTLIKKAKSGEQGSDTLKIFENKVVDALCWVGDKKIIFSLRNVSALKGEIDEIDITSQEVKKITDFNGGQVGYLFANEDISDIAYLVAQYPGHSDDKTKGQIYIYNLLNQGQIGLGKANQILGWLPASSAGRP